MTQVRDSLLTLHLILNLTLGAGANRRTANKTENRTEPDPGLGLPGPWNATPSCGPAML